MHIEKMADRIRQIMPDVALRTTCLVGFPGETDEHFEHLLDFVQRVEFDHLGVFTFSPEEHTAAFDMPDRPDEETTAARRDDLLVVQMDIVDRKAAAMIGTETEVLLEREIPESNRWMGRARRSAPEVDGVVFVENLSADTLPGEFVKVRYTAQQEYDMVAESI